MSRDPGAGGPGGTPTPVDPLDPLDPAVGKPAAVVEAEEKLQTWGLGLGTVGMVGSAVYWFTVARTGPFLPVPGWFAFLLALVALFFFPPTRGARRARELLRRWDEVQVEAALEASGIPTGPGRRRASDLAGRILHHPRADARVQDATRRLLGALRQTGRHRRQLLSSLERLHRAVVVDPAEDLAEARSDAEHMLARLQEGAPVDRTPGAERPEG